MSVAFVTACAASDTVETVYDPCSSLTIHVTSDFPDDVGAVSAAMSAWARVLPVTEVSVISAPPADDVLTVRFVPGQRAIRGAYFDSVGVVEIARDMLAPEAHPIAVAHELGHAFGLLHVEGSVRTSVMNVGNVTIEPTEEDAAEVMTRWATCRDTAP